ncbi:hypothetical protein WKW79_35375 [Variovorax robiniae]|uniref:Uncharacterized protein n=1 Tax=Variovorax robiniae TaxID=1836199 RepID=A0ABU8XJK4_9BURK
MNQLPTPEQLAVVEDDELHVLATSWRKRALHGDKEANGIAHALEVEQRRRARTSQLQQLTPEPAAATRPWWRFWRDEATAREDGDDATSS